MPTPNRETLPKIVNFPIGRRHTVTFTPGPPVDIESEVLTRLVGIVFRVGPPIVQTVLGVVENYGDVTFDLEVDESANNNLANNPFTGGGAADAYADRGIRSDSLGVVATGVMPVAPGGKVIFTIEMTAASDRYLRFQTGATTPPESGRLLLVYLEGVLDPRSRESVT
mgnify:FL=1